MASAVQAGTTSNAGKRSAKEDNRSSSESSDSKDESSSALTHRPASTPMRALKVAGACVYACVCVVLTSLYAVFVLVCANVSLYLHVCNFSGLLYVHVERNIRLVKKAFYSPSCLYSFLSGPPTLIFFLSPSLCCCLSLFPPFPCPLATLRPPPLTLSYTTHSTRGTDLVVHKCIFVTQRSLSKRYKSVISRFIHKFTPTAANEYMGGEDP